MMKAQIAMLILARYRVAGATPAKVRSGFASGIAENKASAFP
ncbi:hypothetical protein FHT79_004851 [Rhizobium sp. BK212]|jgi:hypothetical protein|nr:hypothetical protein [Rhizobium sp. BK212]MBB4217636.1 hypothetical protein [Rhizobium sp. BK212]